MGQYWCPNPQCTTGIAGSKFQPYDENYTWIKCRCGMWLKTQEILDAHLAAYPHGDIGNTSVSKISRIGQNERS